MVTETRKKNERQKRKSRKEITKAGGRKKAKRGKEDTWEVERKIRERKGEG